MIRVIRLLLAERCESQTPPHSCHKDFGVLTKTSAVVSCCNLNSESHLIRKDAHLSDLIADSDEVGPHAKSRRFLRGNCIVDRGEVGGQKRHL